MNRFILLSFFALLWSGRINAIVISVNSSDASCGNPTGWAQVGYVSGGVTPYSYSWSNGSTNYFISNLSPGTYSVTVSDASGSTATSAVTIGSVPNITTYGMSWIRPNSVPTHPCTDHCNGTAYLNTTALNGMAPYAINILNSSNPAVMPGNYIAGAGLIFPTLENLCTNDQLYLMVSDAYGCTGNLMGPLTYPPNFFAFNSIIQGSCTGSSDGIIQLNFPLNQGISYSLSYTGPNGGGYQAGFTGAATINHLPSGSYSFNVVEDLAQSCDTNFILIVPNLGTNCGLIEGDVWLDTVRNCVHDSLEPKIPGRMVQFLPGPYYATTDSTGHYKAMFPFNTYTALPTASTLFTPVCTPSAINLSLANDTVSNVDFGDSTDVSLDLSVSLTNSPARPGFTFTSWGYVYNTSFSASDTINVEYSYDPILTPFNSSSPFSVISPGHLQFRVDPCSGFTSQAFWVSFQVPANPALLGYTLNTSVLATSVSFEPDTTNNSSSVSQVIVGSYDPNAKYSEPTRGPLHNYFTDVDSVLRYTVCCQNTGTDTAFNIMIVDTIDTHLDLATFQWQGSSHPARWEISGSGILKVYFDNILLPDSATDELHSHAQFAFTVRPKPIAQLPLLPFVLNNKADIFFDFNPAITTNTAFNTIDISVGMNSVLDQRNQFSVLPNPARGQVIAKLEGALVLDRLSLMDLTGRELCVFPGEIRESRVLQLPLCPPGCYLLGGTRQDNGKRIFTRLFIY